MNKRIWSKEELSSFCLELSLLLKAGLPVEVCFSSLSEEEQDGDKKDILHFLYEKAAYGSSVYEAMAETDAFPEYMLKMVMVGEETGYLESVFRSLSVYYEERGRTEQALKETVMFPIILLFMMVVVIIILMTEVLPVFQNVFAQLGGTLSPIAMFFLNVGAAIQKGSVLFAVIGVVLLFGVLLILFHQNTREKTSDFFYKEFVKTKTGNLFESAHFASSLRMGVSGGLHTDRALEMAESFCNDTMKNRISACREAVMMGMPLAAAVEEQNLLKPMYCRILSVGVKTGTLDAALEEIARRSEEEASSALQKTASKVEPAVVIILCIIVGVLLLSVMFPLVGIMNSLG